MVGFDDFNPYLPPQNHSVAGDSHLRKAGAGYPIVLFMCMATILTGLALSVVNVETIIASGPVLSILCLIALIIAIRKSFPWGGIFGVSGMVITMFCFALIKSLGWSPRDAEPWIPLVLAGYSLLAIPCGLLAVREHLKRNKQEDASGDR